MNRGNISKTNTRGVLNTTQNTAVVVVRTHLNARSVAAVQRCSTSTSTSTTPLLPTVHSGVSHYQYSVYSNNRSTTSSTVRNVQYTSTRVLRYWVLSTSNGIVLLLISIAAYVITLQRYVSRKYTLLRSTKYYVKNAEGNTIGEFWHRCVRHEKRTLNLDPT